MTSDRLTIASSWSPSLTKGMISLEGDKPLPDTVYLIINNRMELAEWSDPRRPHRHEIDRIGGLSRPSPVCAYSISLSQPPVIADMPLQSSSLQSSLQNSLLHACACERLCGHLFPAGRRCPGSTSTKVSLYSRGRKNHIRLRRTFLRCFYQLQRLFLVLYSTDWPYTGLFLRQQKQKVSHHQHY